MLDNLLGAFAIAVSDRIRSRTQEAVGHSGAAAALVTIAQFPGRTVEFLRRAVGLSQPAAVRVVDRLVADGLVERRPAGGGPAVALTVTAGGRERAATVLALRQEVLADALGDLSSAESAVLAEVVGRALCRMSDAPGTTICRLCDQERCRRGPCPVVERQAALGAPPPAPASLSAGP